MKVYTFTLLILLFVILTSIFPASGVAVNPFQDVVITSSDKTTNTNAALGILSHTEERSDSSSIKKSALKASAQTKLMSDPILGIVHIGIISGAPVEPLPLKSTAVAPGNQSESTQARNRIKRLKANLASRRPIANVPQQGRILITKAAPASNHSSSSGSRASVKRLTIKIPEFIRKILNWFGANLPKNSKIIIIIGGCGTPPTPPTTPPPTPKPPSTTSLPRTIEGLKNYMVEQFGIQPVDGDGASWSQRQLEEANKVLATLPESFRSCTTKIQRDKMFQNSNVLGYVQMGIPTVHLMDSACRQGTFQGTLVHEMTHCFQAKHPDIAQLWKQTFWPLGGIFGPQPPSVSSYGNSSYLEDMAESVRVYWQNGAALKAKQPKRYEFIRKYVMGGREF